MELKITQFFKEAAAIDYSNSIANSGLQNIGEITWNHAVEDSEEYQLLTNDEEREEFRRHMRGFGAWSEAEIAAWTDTELNALLIQCISGDIRESGLDQENPDWEEYQEGCEKGNYSGRLFKGTDGEIYYTIGD